MFSLKLMDLGHAELAFVRGRESITIKKRRKPPPSSLREGRNDAAHDEGCYIRLLSYCWREGSLPSDLDTLKALCKGVDPSSKVLVAFVKKGDKLLHPRLERERRRQSEFRKKMSDGGLKGMSKRWGKRYRHKHLNTDKVGYNEDITEHFKSMFGTGDPNSKN